MSSSVGPPHADAKDVGGWRQGERGAGPRKRGYLSRKGAYLGGEPRPMGVFLLPSRPLREQQVDILSAAEASAWRRHNWSQIILPYGLFRAPRRFPITADTHRRCLRFFSCRRSHEWQKSQGGQRRRAPLRFVYSSFPYVDHLIKTGVRKLPDKDDHHENQK